MKKKKNFSAVSGGSSGNALSCTTVIFIVLSIILKINAVHVLDVGRLDAVDGTSNHDNAYNADNADNHGDDGIISNLENDGTSIDDVKADDPEAETKTDMNNRNLEIENTDMELRDIMNMNLNLNINMNRDLYEDTCNSHLNCSSCTSSSIFCHWCNFDSKCHAKGSIHGCSYGATCNATEAPSMAPSVSPAPSQQSNSGSDSCFAHTDCTSCVTSSIFCHWCEFDAQCHTKGSIHGCAMGATCPDHDKDHDRDHDNNKCSSHTSCTECTLSSKMCHWCAFDDQCHVIGSWYGCSHGVNCFNNDRCKRMEPEKIDYGAEAAAAAQNGANEDEGGGVGFWSMAIIVFIGSVWCCCSSLCFMTVRAVKGAYDDWAVVNYDSLDSASASASASAGNRGHSSESDIHVSIENSINNSTPRPMVSNNLSNIDEEEGEVEVEGGSQPQVQIEKEKQVKNVSDNDDKNHNDLTQPLLPSGDNGNDNDNRYDVDANAGGNTNGNHACDVNDEYNDNPTSTTSSSYQNDLHEHPSNSIMNGNHSRSSSVQSRPTPNSSHPVRCLYNTCLIWYILSLATASIFTFGAIYYFPKIPQFNVCSDEFAWNSIIDSLTSLKVEASFQVLASVKNENHLDITMGDVGGSFRHNGEDIGTFSMPTTTITADSITDLLVTCSVHPDKWEALGLISDYYRGKLEFLINVNGNAKIWGIGYNIPVVVKDMLVKVNDPSMDDRHLCRCPEWKDLYPTVSPVSSFFEAVEQQSR